MTLIELLARSRADFDKLSPEEQAAHRYEQRRSFVRGMCPSRRNYDEWCREVDKLLPPITKSGDRTVITGLS